MSTKLRIKLDNMDRADGLVLVTCEDKRGAKLDQTIAGTRWEAPRDLLEAYALIDDHPGLVDELKSAYDVDDSEYCPHDAELNPRDW